jgi:hypothetical protein
MHCVRFEMRLNRLFDDRASPDSDLELVEHARECPDCAELLAGHELLLRAIVTCDGPSPGSDLAVRVAAEFENGWRQSRRRSWSWTVPAVAAGLLLAFGVWHLLKDPSGSNPSGSDPSGSGNLPKVPLANMPPAVTRGAAHETSSPYYRTLVAGTRELSERLGGQRPEWVDQMADGLKPVADSMSAALHALRRTFPGGESPARSSQFEPLSLSRIAMIG